MCHVPIALSGDQRSHFNSVIRRSRAATSPAQIKNKTKSHMEKIKEKSRVYKVCIIKELAKILNTVLSP